MKNARRPWKAASVKVTEIRNVDFVPSSHFTAISDGFEIGFNRSSASMEVNWSASLAMGRPKNHIALVWILKRPAPWAVVTWQGFKAGYGCCFCPGLSAVNIDQNAPVWTFMWT
jgi:hypothetical protein